MADGLEFASNYDLAAFIVHCIALPVLLVCIVASTCLLRRWKDAGLSLLITYNAAVVLTFISFAFWIADSVVYARIQSSYGYPSSWRPILILDVFANSFDLIFRVATFAVVVYLATVSLSSSKRRQATKFFGIAVVIVLSALTIANIGLRGHNEGFTEAYYDNDFEGSALRRTIAYWASQISGVQMAFYAVYLLAMIVTTVATFLTRNPPLIISAAFLLAITILEIILNAWQLYIQDHPITYVDEFNYDVFYDYSGSEYILEIILQSVLLVTLLFAPRPYKR
ncbi:uncharacterized protein K489DRAFT_371351 [Dissoconium aciculare CBS 342.82]|uniref:Uncharacterized protein n=1 Tax=Dissoconium aciculare CBS 342.82 TaxID=1314786 RepID=A0A6J3M6M9_9PEZI|nr:uncharacterized protein K489DRAFT_371351 [Dissoconium aciculare CBS 342.82]KAF1822527.1 hypothetical protein K489DRAFT_371351 [Dissoconium aciculare CBS 342.82]